MNGTDRQQELVDDYLRRLDRAACALPADRRAELVLEIRDHICEARSSAAGRTDEAWTLTLLDRLGTPEEIVEAVEPRASAAASTVPASWGRILGRFVLGLFWLGLLLSVVGALDRWTLINWVGLGRVAILLGVLLVWATPAWTKAAKWSVSVASVSFLILWPVLLDFPPVPGDAGPDPVRWHWQLGFVVAAVLYAGTLVLLWLDLRTTRSRFRMRELTALLFVGLGWWLGILPAGIAMVVAWRSRGLVPWGRWVGLAILVPAGVAWLTIPLGLVQRVNQDGFLDVPSAWVVTGVCSAVLFAWLTYSFARAERQAP